MGRCKAGSKAAERRLRKHAEAMAALAAIRAETQAGEQRLAAQEAARLAAEEEARAMRVEAIRIRTEQIGPYFPVRVHAARLAAEQSAREKAKPINTIMRELRTRREERRAAEAAARIKTVAPPTPVTRPDDPIAAIGRYSKSRAPKITLQAQAPGWWDVVVTTTKGTAGTFTLPFYQHERPDPAHVAQAATDEITRRMNITAQRAKPRKPKAPAMPGKQPRETAKIRRIERAMEGV
jgi:hypothetical protein